MDTDVKVEHLQQESQDSHIVIDSLSVLLSTQKLRQSVTKSGLVVDFRD